jgi:EEF1A lysine methyltransferase 2
MALSHLPVLVSLFIVTHPPLLIPAQRSYSFPAIPLTKLLYLLRRKHDDQRTRTVKAGHEGVVSRKTIDSVLQARLIIAISWDSVYEDELANYAEIGDEGEIWYLVPDGLSSRSNCLFCRFGLQTIHKTVAWALEHIPPAGDPSILEIGSGNGTLILGLVEAGYAPNRACGIDYSPDAVKLAQSIARDRGAHEVTFALCDVLNDDPPPLPTESFSADGPCCWDLVLDKGTFDAIALGEKDAHGLSPAAPYPERVARLVKPGGIFFITCAYHANTYFPNLAKPEWIACNFTEGELRGSFATAETGLVCQFVHVQLPLNPPQTTTLPALASRTVPTPLAGGVVALYPVLHFARPRDVVCVSQLMM